MKSHWENTARDPGSQVSLAITFSFASFGQMEETLQKHVSRPSPMQVLMCVVLWKVISTPSLSTHCLCD